MKTVIKAKKRKRLRLVRRARQFFPDENPDGDGGYFSRTMKPGQEGLTMPQLSVDQVLFVSTVENFAVGTLHAKCPEVKALQQRSAEILRYMNKKQIEEVGDIILEHARTCPLPITRISIEIPIPAASGNVSCGSTAGYGKKIPGGGNP